MAQNEGDGEYNSIQASLRGTTLQNDLTYQVGYTYSHTNDSFDGITESDGDLYDVSNPYAGWRYDYGPSAFDIRNNFFTNFVYRIPLLNDSAHHLLKTTLGGWEISGIVTAISGAPLNIGLSGQNVASIVPNTANRPDVSGAMMNPHTIHEWFDTSVFSVPAPGTWGDEPHNAVRGPGHDNWNISLFKENFLFQQRARRPSPIPRRILQPLEPPAMGWRHPERRHQQQLRREQLRLPSRLPMTPGQSSWG